MNTKISCRFNSEWDGGYVVSTAACLDLETGAISDIEVVEPIDDEGCELESLDRQFVDFLDMEGEFVVAENDDNDYEVPGIEAVYATLDAAERLPMGVLRELWALLGDRPVNDEGCLGEWFLSFPEGSHREDVWRWFESKNPDFSAAAAMGVDAPTP